METIKLEYPKGGRVYGARPEDFAPYKQWDEVRQVARLSVDRFVAENAHYLTGRVLDFGAGKPGTCAKPEPYRGLVRGEYVPYDVGDDYPKQPFGAIICTQVIQYVNAFQWQIEQFQQWLEPNGALVMSYTVNWDEIETEHWRFTKLGMATILQRAGFRVLTHERLCELKIDGVISFPMMNGVVCRK
jgi:hypothetical protein